MQVQMLEKDGLAQVGQDKPHMHLGANASAVDNYL